MTWHWKTGTPETSKKFSTAHYHGEAKLISVFSNINEENFREYPYSYVITTQALDPAYYQELATNFPDVSTILSEGLGKNNVLILLPTLKFLAKGLLAPIWQEFIEYHHSPAFFQEMVGIFGDQIRQAHPDLEARLGKSLESLTVSARGSGIDTDVSIECQFGLNTPVSTPSRVRGFHVDNPKKISNAILYMPLDEDTSEGGHFQIGRFRGQPKFQGVSVSDEEVEVVDHVIYQANTLISMINTPFALHAVSPRMPTPHPRRYINFLAELRKPIFDLAPFQDSDTP
jgi:hypothetical protein